MPRPLPQSFFARECLEVAADLLGKLLCAGPVVLRIAEVEAYRFPGDTANHCRFGRTARNAPMWGPAGHAYVYLCYGMHALLNLVTDGEDRGAAVLIRACEPVEGLEHVAARRRGRSGPELLNGPGKVAAALAVTVRHSGLRLSAQAGLFVADQPAVSEFLVGPRVGVDYAHAVDRAAPWRLALPSSPWVGKQAGLRPWTRGLNAFLSSERLGAARSLHAAHGALPPADDALPLRGADGPRRGADAALPGRVARPAAAARTARAPARTRRS